MPRQKRDRPWYTKLVWKDWLAKTQDMSTLERGALIGLMGYAATCSEDCCSVPADTQRLARAAGLSLRHWRRVAARVLAEFVEVRSENGATVRHLSVRMQCDALKYTQVVAKNTANAATGTPEVPHRDPIGVPARAVVYSLESTKKKTRSVSPETEPSPPPDWLPPKDWADFEAHRKASKHPLTPRAAELVIAKIGRLRAEGHDPSLLIQTAIERGWRTVFPGDERPKTSGADW